MKKNALGRTGLEVTELSLGTLILGKIQANLSVEEGAKAVAKAKSVKPKSEPMPKCQCGAVMPSRRFRDFYRHVAECHPGGEIAGIPCQTCHKPVPFGLNPCHHYFEHNMRPPLGADFETQMREDYKVLKLVEETLTIVASSLEE